MNKKKQILSEKSRLTSRQDKEDVANAKPFTLEDYMTKNNEEIIKKLPIENTERKLNPSIFKGKGNYYVEN